MATVSAAVESVATPAATRGKPRRSFVGQTRKQLRHLKKVLQNLQRADDRESARAQRLGYTPSLFQGQIGSAHTRAMTQLKNRAQACLDETYQ